MPQPWIDQCAHSNYCISQCCHLVTKVTSDLKNRQCPEPLASWEESQSKPCTLPLGSFSATSALFIEDILIGNWSSSKLSFHSLCQQLSFLTIHDLNKAFFFLVVLTQPFVRISLRWAESPPDLLTQVFTSVNSETTALLALHYPSAASEDPRVNQA